MEGLMTVWDMVMSGYTEEASLTDQESNEENACELDDDFTRCPTVDEFLLLIEVMTDEIIEISAEVIRWRQVLLKYLPSYSADCLEGEIFSNIGKYLLFTFYAYEYFVHKCHNGIDPMDNDDIMAYWNRLRKGEDPSSIKYF